MLVELPSSRQARDVRVPACRGLCRLEAGQVSLAVALGNPVAAWANPAAVRAALYEWAYWKRIGWFHEYWRGEFDLPLVLAFSVSCFAIACRLTGGMDQRSRKAARLLPADGGPSLR